jgi:hypothetical protein
MCGSNPSPIRRFSTIAHFYDDLGQILNAYQTGTVNPESVPGTPGSGDNPNLLFQQQFQDEFGHPLFNSAGPTGSSDPFTQFTPQGGPNLPPIPVMPGQNPPPPSNGPTPNGPTPNGPIPPNGPFIWTFNGNGPWQVGPNWSPNAVPGSHDTVEINSPFKVTISDAEQAGTLILGNSGAILNIIDGGSLTIFQAIQNLGIIQLNSTGADPTLLIDGSISLTGGGEIKLLGPTADNLIIGVAGTGATLTNVDNTIIGSGQIGQGDGNLTFVNSGTVNATPLQEGDSGKILLDTGNTVFNSGILEATNGGTLDVQDSEIHNTGTGAHGIIVDGTSELLVDTTTLRLTGGGSVSLASGSLITRRPDRHRYRLARGHQHRHAGSDRGQRTRPVRHLPKLGRIDHRLRRGVQPAGVFADRREAVRRDDQRRLAHH